MKIVKAADFAASIRKGAPIADAIIEKEVAVEAATGAASNMLTFTFSTPSVDRSGDRVMPMGIDTDGYLTRNPIILLHHEMHAFPIGKCVALEKDAAGLRGTIEFFTDLDEAGIGENARATVELVRRGVMGISITFLPRQFELNATDGVDFLRSELVEVSCVTVPCNRDAFPADRVPVVDPAVSNDLATRRSRAAEARRRALALVDH